MPATIFLVTDHLYHLLVKNYMRRDKAAGALLGAGRGRGRAGAGGAPGAGLGGRWSLGAQQRASGAAKAAGMCSCWVPLARPDAGCAPRPPRPGSDDDRWTRAVYRLHATIFQVGARVQRVYV